MIIKQRIQSSEQRNVSFNYHNYCIKDFFTLIIFTCTTNNTGHTVFGLNENVKHI